MKAVLCHAFGAPETLRLDDVESPTLHPGEVRIAVQACGVNYPDLLMVQGLYQARPPFPFAPGLEIAGDVLEVAPDVQEITPGQRVIAIVNHGGFAEEVCAPAAMVLPMPDTMSYEDGAVFPVVYGTSHLALTHRAHLQPGETLLVLGAAGGVGLTAVELGKLLGAQVIAAASSPQKLALAQQYGADHLINYSEEDLRDRMKVLTGAVFADVIYDPVGGDLFDAAVRCLAWEGRYLVIGFASGRIPELPVNRVLLKNSSLVGVYWGAYAQHGPQVLRASMEQLLTWYAAGRIKPHIGGRYRLSEAPAALRALQERTALGKLVLLRDEA